MGHINLHHPPFLNRTAYCSDHSLHRRDGSLDDPVALRSFSCHQKRQCFSFLLAAHEHAVTWISGTCLSLSLLQLICDSPPLVPSVDSTSAPPARRKMRHFMFNSFFLTQLSRIVLAHAQHCPRSSSRMLLFLLLFPLWSHSVHESLPHLGSRWPHEYRIRVRLVKAHRLRRCRTGFVRPPAPQTHLASFFIGDLWPVLVFSMYDSCGPNTKLPSSTIAFTEANGLLTCVPKNFTLDVFSCRPARIPISGLIQYVSDCRLLPPASPSSSPLSSRHSSCGSAIRSWQLPGRQ